MPPSLADKGDAQPPPPAQLQRQPSYDEVVYDIAEKADMPARACDACRKMKIRCIDKENPPCKRCRHMKLQCRFAMGPFPRVVLEDNEATKQRLEQLEGHVSGIYHKLEEMSSALLRFAGPAETPSATTETPADSVSPRAAMAKYSQPPKRPMSAPSAQPDGPRPPGPTTAASAPSVPHSNPSAADTPWSTSTDEVNPYLVRDPGSGGFSYPTSSHGLLERLSLTQLRTTSTSRGTGVRSPSPDMSDDDDPLESAMEGEPFRHFTQREEELHFLREGHDEANLPRPKKRPTSHGRGREARAAGEDDWHQNKGKRRRLGASKGPFHADWDLGSAEHVDSQNEWEEPLPIREKGDPLRNACDPITMGYMSEEEGRRLFQSFFKYAHPFVPVFDPREDTFDKMRRRSPFCVTVMVLVGLRRETCGPPSELCRLIQKEVEKMATLTLFSPVATLETVQGLTILVSYSEHAWRTCCHAMALGVDMRLYRCLPYLHKIRMESGHPDHMLERQRPLVVGARLWLALVRLAYEMSFNHALPVLFPSERGKRAQYARELLDHPLSTLYDSRLVNSVELCEVRENAFKPYESISAQDPAQMDVCLREANNGIQSLYDYWLGYYRAMGLSEDHFLMVELDNQRAYSIMFTNSPAWYGVRSKDDVKLLSPERQQWVSAAMRGAAFLVSSVAHKRLEKESEFGNHNFYIGIVSTAKYVIRMAELLPDVCNLHQVSLDIDRLLIRLPDYPTRPFANGLRRTLAKAREQGILPYTQMSAAHPKVPSPEPARPGRRTSRAHPNAVADGVQEYPGINPFPWNDPVHVLGAAADAATWPGADPAGPAASVGTAAPGSAPPLLDTAWPDEFNLAAWFPAAEDPNAPLDVGTALDTDMANWFPAAPQVWLEDV